LEAISMGYKYEGKIKHKVFGEERNEWEMD
jgi:hypothetical protein